MKPMQRFYSLILTMLAMDSAFAQKGPVTTIGRVLSVTTAGPRVLIDAQNAHAEIMVYGPDIFRLRLSPGSLSAYFSYAVVSEPVKTSVKVTQDPKAIYINTDSLSMRVEKDPFSIILLNRVGDTINADEEGLTTSWVGSECTTYKHLQEGERFIGLGEKTGDLDRKGNGYLNWNSDFYGYSITQDPLYSSIPFYIGIHHQVSYGIFLDNSYESSFNFGASNNRFSSFSVRGGEMCYYLIYGRQVAGIISAYTSLTGRMPLPPLWSLGYQQNRYSYYPDTEVLRIAETLREKKIPSDGITLDIHYMDAYKLFTWNRERFPDPKALTDRLGSMGFKLTVIVDPGIKVEKGYPAYESGSAANIFLKYPDGTDYTAKVWPGWCHFPDFTNPKARIWWEHEIKSYTDQGVAGIWNDMNEISTWGQQVPANVLYNFDGHLTTMLEGHNVFALEMIRSSYNGARAGGRRPFILTRSGFAGLQRYSAIWTGDNRSEESHLFAGVRLLESLGISGVSFTGMDVGGFTGNPSAALFARWMELGAFLPYFRNHSALNTRSSEPWTYGEDILDISRDYVSLRYRLLPYLYSTFYESTQNGLPVLRSLCIDDSYDSLVYDTRFQQQFLFGPSLLVAPVGESAAFTQVYLPPGKWYDLYSGKEDGGNQVKTVPLTLGQLPVYVRGGAILPMESLIQSTADRPSDTLRIHLYKGDRASQFTYYEDDGVSYDYEKGLYYKREMRYDPTGRTFTLTKPEGDLPSRFHYLAYVLHGFDGLTQVDINGEKRTLLDSSYDFLALPKGYALDALPEMVPTTVCPVKIFVTENTPAFIVLKYLP